MSANDGSDVSLHERIFAQVLGVEENEEFATELTYYAADLLQILPPGWIVEIGEGELAGIPLFVFTDTEETEWNHPYESEYRRRIIAKRKELQDSYPLNNINTQSEINTNEFENNPSEFNTSVFNASSIATDFTENDSQVFAVVPPVPEGARENEDDASESPVASDELSDYEVLFAQVLGVALDEKHFLPLAFFAKELLKIVPEGWELLLSKSQNNVRVPYFYEQATRSSHWVHPYENQYRDLINKKREDLVATQAPSPIPTPMSTARSFVSESSMNSVDRISLVEAMFAGALGISPFEEFAGELGDYAKELLVTLPPGWELVVADTGKTTEVFPLFVHREGATQLEHPLMGDHIQSIDEMRTTLLYGVLPSEFSLTEPERAGASAEASVEFKQQEAARQAEEEASRSVATMKSFEARIAEAERVAAERAAADQKAKAELAEAQAKKDAEDRLQEEEDRRAAAKERVRLAHIAREQAEKAFHDAQQARIEEEEAEAAAEAAREAEKKAEEQRLQDKIDAEKRQIEAKERQLQEDLQREAQRLQDIADRIAAEVRAEQEAIETAEKERRMAEKLAAEIRMEEEEAAVRAAEQAALQAVQDAIDAELAAKQAIEDERLRAIEREWEEAEAAIRAAREAEERAVAEAAAEAARLVAEEAQRIENERLEKERLDEEARQEAARVAAAAAAAQAAAQATELLESFKVLVAALVEEALASAVDKIEALQALSAVSTVVSNEVTVIHDGWIMSPPVPGTPTNADVALWGEPEQVPVVELSAEELEAQKLAEAATAAETVGIQAVIELLAQETVVDLLPAVTQDAIDALRQEIVDKERAIVEAREAEERATKERAEKRLAARKAAELAAQEALRRAEEEEAALEEAARVLFRKELELARQASTLSSERSSPRAAKLTGPAAAVATESVPAEQIAEAAKVEVEAEQDVDDEPDVLALTIPSEGIAFDLPPESPDSARLDSARMSVHSHPSVTTQAFTELKVEPTRESGAFDLMTAQSNAIKLSTHYLDQSKHADKTRLVSKRSSISETEKTIIPKNVTPKNVTIDLRTDSSDLEHRAATAGINLTNSDSEEEAETSDSAEHAHRKDWKSKILRPLSKVSPKKEAQRRRRAASAAATLRHATPGRGDTRKERLWEMKVDETEASRAVSKMKWYRLGCYGSYDEALHARKVVMKMVINDSLGTIIFDPRVDISDFDLVVSLQTQSFDAVQGLRTPNANATGSREVASAGAGFPGLGLSGAFSASRATTASPTFRRGTAAASSSTSSRSSIAGNNNNTINVRPTSSAFTPKSSALLGLTAPHSHSQSHAGTPTALGSTGTKTAVQRPTTGTLPAANDTRELILGRVKRTTEKMVKLRVRKDLSRMQWVLEADDAEVNKITDRHRKKKGVDIEGKVENVVGLKAKKALREIIAAREANDDLATQTLKKLPAMEELLESNLLEVLSTSKSFGGFSLTSKLVAGERQLKEEINARVGAIKSKMALDEKKNRALSRSPSRGVRPASPSSSSLASGQAAASSGSAPGPGKFLRVDSGALLMNNIHSSPSAKMGKSMSTKLPEINRKSVV